MQPAVVGEGHSETGQCLPAPWGTPCFLGGSWGSRLQEAVVNVFWNSLELTHSSLSVGPQTPTSLGGAGPSGSFSPQREGPRFLALSPGCLVPFPAGGPSEDSPPAATFLPGVSPGRLPLRAGGGKVTPRPGAGAAPLAVLPAPRPCSWGRQVEGLPGSVRRMRRVCGCAGPRDTGPQVLGPLGAEGNRAGQWGR